MSDADIVRAVALLIHHEALRQQRQWDYQGVWAVVRRAVDEDGRDPRQIVEAGFGAIEDKATETPGAILWANRYPNSGATDGPRMPKCRTCGRTRPAHDLAETKTPIEYRHDFAEEAALLQSPELAALLVETLLGPLSSLRLDDGIARETLRQYLDCSQNVSSTAGALGVNRRTVEKRLRQISEALGRPLAGCAAKIDLALRLETLGVSIGGDPPWGGGARS